MSRATARIQPSKTTAAPAGKSQQLPFLLTAPGKAKRLAPC
ncbi:hypothetical protein ACFV47_44725 [Streptomyces solisilvae]